MSDYAFLLDAPATATGRIQIAKLGSFKDKRYGEFDITADDIKSWQSNLSALPGGRALIDLDHSADRSPRNTEAAGWITGVELDGDTPYAQVEWTPVGKQAIEEKRYLFFSPTYGKHRDESGDVHENTLIGGALTNRPFLNMPAISLASDERVSAALDLDPAARFYTRALDGELGELTKALVMLDISAKERKQAAADGNALEDGSYPIRNAHELHSAAVLAASGHGDVKAARALIRKRAKELGVSLAHLPGFRAESSDSRRAMDKEVLIETLGLAADTDDDGVLNAIKELQAAKDEPVTLDATMLATEAGKQGKILLDSTQFAQLSSDAKAGKEAADELRTQKFETAFTKALSEGKVVPAERESFEKFYALDADTTITTLAERPQIVNVKPANWQNGALTVTDAPDGVDPEGHKLDQAVKTRLREQNLPMSEYPRVLEQLMEEGS